MAQDLIQDFTTELINEAGFNTLPEKEFNEYRQQVAALVSQRLGMDMIGLLSPADFEEYGAVMDKQPNPAEIYAFFESRVPDLNAKVRGILAAFRKEFLQDVADSERMSADQ